MTDWKVGKFPLRCCGGQTWTMFEKFKIPGSLNHIIIIISNDNYYLKTDFWKLLIGSEIEMVIKRNLYETHCNKSADLHLEECVVG